MQSLPYASAKVASLTPLRTFRTRSLRRVAEAAQNFIAVILQSPYIAGGV